MKERGLTFNVIFMHYLDIISRSYEGSCAVGRLSISNVQFMNEYIQEQFETGLPVSQWW
jgi:hypothetical protein